MLAEMANNTTIMSLYICYGNPWINRRRIRHSSLSTLPFGNLASTVSLIWHFTWYWIISQGEELIVGNVGDSRAVLATSSGHTPSNGNDVDPGAHMILEAVQLTVDLKPDIPSKLIKSYVCIISIIKIGSLSEKQVI